MQNPTGTFTCATCGRLGYEDQLVITEDGCFHQDCTDCVAIGDLDNGCN